MIKFSGVRDGKPMFGFGLSEGNVRKLREGRPILVDLSEMGSEGSVLIFYGKTEQDMMDEFRNAGIIRDPFELRPHDDSKEQP